MAERHSYKDKSRIDWGRALDDGQVLGRDELTLGALLRIADATEAMAENHVRLQEDRDWYERRLREETAARKRLQHANAALRGHIKRIKARR